jgi:hypothetical protein
VVPVETLAQIARSCAVSVSMNRSAGSCLRAASKLSDFQRQEALALFRHLINRGLLRSKTRAIPLSQPLEGEEWQKTTRRSSNLVSPLRTKPRNLRAQLVLRVPTSTLVFWRAQHALPRLTIPPRVA